MGLFDTVTSALIPGYGVGSNLGATTTPTSTLTSEQSQLLQSLIGQYYDESGNFQAPGISPDIQNVLTKMLSGSPQSFEDYYQNVVYNPAVQEYENVTRPGFLESLGSLHSGSRANLEATSRQNLANQLSSTRASLAKTAQDQASQLQLAGLQQNLAYSQVPFQQMLSLLGVPGVENIVTQPSLTTGLLSGIPGIGTSFSNYF